MDNQMKYNEGENSRAGSVLNLLAGLWLLISPFALGYSVTAAITNGVVTGIIVAILAIVGLALPSQSWSRWINLLAGIWLIIAAFVFSYVSAGVVWNNAILGILVIAFAGWSLNAVSVQHEHQHHHFGAGA